jgi:predicted dehydrogenase
MISVGIIGVGRWGPNVLRNFASLEGVRVHAVCDIDSTRLLQIKKRFADLQVTADASDILHDSAIECVVVATPIATHFSLAREAIVRGHHVFVEKPMALSSVECAQLIALAEQERRILFVGHTFKYNAGIRAAKEYIERGELGKIFLIDANRTNLGPVRYDANALWDLAAHDISIFSYWLGTQPHSVSARGGCYLNKGVEDVVYATFEYQNGMLAHVHASWLNPKKVREITVVGEHKMLVWNDMNLSEPIRIYNRGFERDDAYQDTFESFRLSIREGEVIIPTIQLNEPLLTECEHFIHCVRTGTPPLTDGIDGLNVVKVLEAATASMSAQGKAVVIR